MPSIRATAEPALPAEKSTTTDGAPIAPEHVEFFEQKIRPVLVTHCYECHSMPGKAKAGLRLDSRAGVLAGGESGPALVVGKPQESLLLAALRHEGLEMPPTGKLSADVIADFARWIELGAPDPRSADGTTPAALKTIDLETARQHWAFQPVAVRGIPPVQDAQWPSCDIDRFILAKLEAVGLHPADDAPRDVWLRRVTFDLIGLPPTPAEQADFGNDTAPAAYERVVDRLLASPRFGERWGRHWLDVARYGESTGKDRNAPYAQAWRYRNWVIDAVNADKPYDQFLIEQLAGDLLPAMTTEQRNAQLTATGFLAVGLKGLNEFNPEAYLLEVADEQIDVTSRSMLGLTVACARCHDHKFDPIPTTDYYALAGIFRSSEVYDGVTPSRLAGDPKRLLPLASDQPEPAALIAARQAMLDLETQCAEAQNEIARLRRENQTDLKPTQQRRKILEENYNLSSSAYFAAAADAVVMAVTDRTPPMDIAVRIRGEVQQLGAQVPRDVLTIIKPLVSATMPVDSSGRLQLARWIASPDNPLTARVAVNRAWSKLFGVGIVATGDNFGLQCEEPAHAALLDNLALRFVQEGWSLRTLLRELVLSRTYRQGSQENDPRGADVDGMNQLLWHFPRRRLEAEAIRDAVLVVSGRLDFDRPAGSPVGQLGTMELTAGANVKAILEANRNRSVYLPLVRGHVPEMLRLFDQADPNLIVPQRDVTGTPPQALYLMNSTFMLENAEQLATRLLTERSDAERVDLLYRLTLGRAATSAERDRILVFVRSPRDDNATPLDLWTLVSQAVLSMPEFRFVF
jgi:cytochrome c553